MWAIPQQAKLKYTQLFNVHDRNRSGFLSGLQCRDILLQSGLPRNVLADIWNLSDIDGDGQLTREEFILAMHLTNNVRSGQALPSELPDDLVPPSYRRTRSISTTSVHSASSSVAASANDDQASQKSAELSTTGSVLNSHSFEDKRRENFEKGRAELERRRLKMIEQQTSILNEQLAVGKKQVAEAKAKIDKMRSERDTKAGLITSLEAQLQTIRERKTYLEQEESSLIAIAKDLNLVNSADAIEIDAQATKIKQENIKQMKEKLIQLQQENSTKAGLLLEVKAKLEESMNELKKVSEEVDKTYENYEEKLSKAKIMREQFIVENKSKTIDLDSIWDSAPSFSPQNKSETFQNKLTEPSAFDLDATDPWAAPATNNNNNINNKLATNETFSFEDNATTTSSAFEQARDYSAFVDLTKTSDPIKARESNAFDDALNNSRLEPFAGKRKYRALYAFEARNPDELTINPGDIIIGSEVVCEPGWLSGETNGKNGLFPEAYVEALPVEDIDVGAITPTAKMNLKSSTTNATTPTIDSSPARPRYSVLYEFKARNVDELTIKPGDIIIGVEGAHEPGWLMGELNGQTGLFPEAYVEKLAETTQAEQTTEPLTGKSRAKKAEVATVIANYRALGQEQLNLEKGQLVLIRRKMNSGWWEGELQIKGPKELDHLIDELISSECDFLNDLRLCHKAYIVPLSASLETRNEIFNSWRQLMDLHETTLNRIANCEAGQLSYGIVLEQFERLLSSIGDVYTRFCSHHSESTRQLESKMASDIRFRQLVKESQRSLKQMIELQADPEIRSRAIRNSNLPLDSFLIKPMQRITKYSLLFERMLNVISNNGAPMELEKQVVRLKEMAEILCQRVNEACRRKQDEETNETRLRWCQSHIKQQKQPQSTNPHQYQHLNHHCPSPVAHEQPAIVIDGISMISKSITNDLKLAESLSTASSRSSILSLNSHVASTTSIINEVIFFKSDTKHLGPRRLIKAGSLIKLRPSCRELVVFLFNDLLLLTQVKNNQTLRVDDIFKSDQAQQAYYKLYRPPILLENVIVRDSDSSLASNEGPTNLNTTNSLLCGPISSSLHSFDDSLVISLLDKSDHQSYNLMAMNETEREAWLRELSVASDRARELRAIQMSQDWSSLRRKISIHDCIGRLFVTVLEFNRTKLQEQPSNQINHGIAHDNSFQASDRWQRMSFISPRIQNVCLTIQLFRYKRPSTGANQQPLIIPLSDAFKTKTFPWFPVGFSPCDDSIASGCNPNNGSTDCFRFDDDSTQFLIANKLIEVDEADYLHFELVEESRYKPPQLIARKRLSVDRLIGSESTGDTDATLAHINSPLEEKHWSPRQSGRSERLMARLQPNRPTELALRLVPYDRCFIASPLASRKSTGALNTTDGLHLSPSQQQQHNLLTNKQLRYSVKLRLHLQTFCDNSQ